MASGGEDKKEKKEKHNFYYQNEERNFEDTPDFLDADDKISEEEKRMDLSQEASDNKPNSKAKPVIVFDINNDEEKEDDEAEALEGDQSKPKHRFNVVYDPDTEDIQITEEVDQKEQAHEKVEETPENHDFEESDRNEEGSYVVGEKPRTSPTKKYKGWTNNAPNEPERENVAKTYGTIEERIKDSPEHSSPKKSPVKSVKKPGNDVRKNQNENSNDKGVIPFDVERSLSGIREQVQNVERKVDSSMNSNFYNQDANRQDFVRHTISVPSNTNFAQNRENMMERQQETVDYQRRDNYGQVSQSVSKARNSQADLHQNPLESNMNPKPPLNASSSDMDVPFKHMIQEQMRMMKAQQDKILENQNIFQTYITNEITMIKNRLNQLESDILLSKTLGASPSYEMPSMQSHTYQ